MRASASVWRAETVIAAPFRVDPRFCRRRTVSAERGRVNDAGDGPAGDDKGDRNGPARIAREERARAVDRINDQNACAGEARRIVFGLLRQPAGACEGRAEPRAQERVDREIGFGDGRTAGFEIDARAGARSRVEVF